MPDAGFTCTPTFITPWPAQAVQTAVTRPANTTAYTAGDVCGAADTATPANAGSAIIELTKVGPPGQVVLLRTMLLRIAATAVPSGMTTFKVWLFNASPTAVLDNAAWPGILTADRAKYTGINVDLSAAADDGEQVNASAFEINKEVKLAEGSSSLFAIVQTIGAFTPASGTVNTLQLTALPV